MEDYTNTTKINGIQIYYEYVKNPKAQYTAILIHGFLSSSFSFRHLIPLMKEEYEVLSIDFPPFGKSGKTAKFVYSYQNIASTLNKLIETLQLKNVVLIGHSMGGQICLHMIHQKPHLFQKAVLLASSGYLKRARKILIALSYLPFFHLIVKMHFAKSIVRENIETLVHDRSIINEEMIYGYLQPFIQNDDIFIALTRMIRDREGDLSSRFIRQIETPCLLLWGKEDPIVPLSIGKRLQKDLPNSQLVVLPKTGHLLPEERPKEIFYFINNFISKN